MNKINFPCRVCGGEQIVIDDVVTCPKCNSEIILPMFDVDDPDGIPGISVNDSNVEFGRKPTRLETNLYTRSHRSEE
jgi:hypothetical protein